MNDTIHESICTKTHETNRVELQPPAQDGRFQVIGQRLNDATRELDDRRAAALGQDRVVQFGQRR